ncbi:MAG: GxxExxY protein [Bacteroidota bacterium]
MEQQKHPYANLTHEIIGAAMEVHNALRFGFREVYYQRALAVELKERGLEFKREVEVDLFYKRINIGNRRVDFIVENKIIVELKATPEIENKHLAQAIHYVELFNHEIGLLINFGTKSLQFKRIISKKYKP